IDLVQHGYVVAVADFRGLYASFGENRLFNFGNFLEPAWTDAYDITEWLADQPWSTGNIGMWGCSATGGSQQQAMVTQPPSLKAIFALSPAYDTYEFVNLGGIPSRAPYNSITAAERDMAASPVDGPDGEALLDEARSQHIDDPTNMRSGQLPYRDSTGPVLGDWWGRSAIYSYRDEIEQSGVAVYNGGNWDEAGTKIAPGVMFGNMPEGRRKLIYGPAQHCRWNHVEEQTGFALSVEQLRFFDYWLKGIDNGVMDEPPVTYYTYNAPE
ncbi:MAG: CocE/NonD family hydrolase, partial [Xanthomonadales bacterium]|nr:CocE/NonD family hydrolase [Xanthomonadales bacterium]NIX14290.1 CocE/NonD family hydrolase [Xanthomonadales bacterium]